MDEFEECSNLTCWCQFTDWEDLDDDIDTQREGITMAAKKKKKAPSKKMPMKPKC